MIRFKALILPLILLSACSEPTAYRDELVERDGVLYEKFSTLPFNGRVVGSTQGRLEDGKWTGEVLVFGKDGNLLIERNYRNGVKHGDHLFYGGGFLRARYTYENGEKTRFTRFEDGVIVVDSNFKNGLPHGITEFFYDNGNLQYRTYYDSGELLQNVLDVYSLDGDIQLKVPIYRHVMQEGSRFYADGKVEMVGDQTCSVEYEKGTISVARNVPPPKSMDAKAKPTTKCEEVIKGIIDHAELKTYNFSLVPMDDLEN